MLKHLLHIIYSLHDIYLAHQLFRLPVNTSNMASPPTNYQVTEAKRNHCFYMRTSTENIQYQNSAANNNSAIQELHLLI